MIPKKSLGQNFLNSPSALDKILKSAEIKKGETILEIGPGKGILTGELLAAGGNVIAIEKDEELAREVQKKFENFIKEGKLKIITGDALDMDFSSLIRETGRGEYKVVANIPYYITGHLFRKIFLSENLPNLVVLLIQKEVAERVVAKNEKESILSLSIKAYGKPEYVATVSSGSFYPQPKVDSAILKIENISRENFSKNQVDEKKFFSVLKRGFSQKRKKLKNNLPLNEQIMQKCEIEENKRAEDLKLENWFCLTKNV